MKIKQAELVASAPRHTALPESGLPEIAFLGRSNVGKSSLLNALVRRKKLARTSSTPGKTRELVLFRVETDRGDVGLVDLPGYGWAQVSRRERAGWKKLVEGYLAERGALRLAVLLQDLRRDWSEDEALLVDWLREVGVPTVVVLTKSDKLKSMRRKQRRAQLAEQIGEAGVRVLLTSSQKRDGLGALWEEIFERVEAGDDTSSHPEGEA